MTFKIDQVVSAMRESGFVPLFTHDNIETVQQVIEAAYQGGVRVFEFTNRKKNSLEVYAAALDYFKKYQDLMLGIGTIMDGASAKKFIHAGAHFIVSPIFKPEIALVCRDYDKLWIPGCATLTEIVNAKEHGAKVIKVFPGSVLGPGFVSSIMPVVPDLQLLITGGVEPNLTNLRAWFGAGAMCVGLGSKLFTKEIIETGNWTLLQQQVSESLSIIAQAKNEHLQ
jgi:2-dehydro-3-deoxyphosphogluconate aldolase/(4S)-4-hydroxy-2-oxoglutarate aldolase